jgi:transcriptional regulator with XRE-family HTH domain
MNQRAHELRHRLRAARELAGFESVEDLAVEIGDEYGYSRSTLYALEQGRYDKPPGPGKLTRIAEACGLDVAWFYVDIKQAVQREGRGLPASELQRRLRADRPAPEDPGPLGFEEGEDYPPSSAG